MKQLPQSVDEAQDYLLNYSPEKLSGETYTLDRMVELMKQLGNPQDKLKVIHIAGTSGKTSTSYFVRGLLEHAGAQTGLTVSPHVISLTERFQIAGKPLSDEKFLTYLHEFLRVVERLDSLGPTYFELIIALAYWIFEREKVDYAVMEVGLGGGLDATNVAMKPDKICVITPIGLDHINVLGSTVGEIATHKAGIIQRNNVVFSAPQEPAAVKEIQTQAKTKMAELHEAATKEFRFNLPLFQRANFSLAIDVFEFIARRDGLQLLSEHDLEYCSHLVPPGRFELFQIGSKQIILDGAHNPQKLRALQATLKQQKIERAAWLVSFVEAPDQKIEECLEVLAEIDIDHIVFTEFSLSQDFKGRHSMSSVELLDKSLFSQTIASKDVDAKLAFERLVKNDSATTIIVTGSLFLVSLLRPIILKLSASN